MSEISLTDWTDEIDRILRKADDIDKRLEDIGRKLLGGRGFNCTVPSEFNNWVAMAVDRSKEDVREIRNACSKLRDAFFSPNRKFINGLPLTRENFNLLSAQGIIKMHRDELNDYEVFMLYHYKDEKIEGYIWPSETRQQQGPGKRRARMKLAGEVAPEDVRISYLSDEQKAYFKSRLPELYSRFRHD